MANTKVMTSAPAESQFRCLWPYRTSPLTILFAAVEIIAAPPWSAADLAAVPGTCISPGWSGLWDDRHPWHRSPHAFLWSAKRT